MERQYATAVAAAPLVLLASTIAYVANGDGMNDGELGGVLQVWAFALFALAAVSLTRRFSETAPGAASAWLAVGLVGAAGGVAYGIDSIQAAVFGNTSIQEADTAAALVALQIPGFCFPIGLIGAGVMLAKTATASAWAARLLVVGAVLFPLSRIPDIEALALVGDAVLLLAMGAIALEGVRVRTGSRSPAR